MAAAGRFLLLVVTLSMAACTLAKPAEDKVTASDVHLNSVLPESENYGQKQEETTNTVVDQVQVASGNQATRLELQPEDQESTTSSPVETIPTSRPVGPNSPTYFSRVITSIFEIPIAVLTAVRNLLQTTASAPKYVPSA